MKMVKYKRTLLLLIRGLNVGVMTALVAYVWYVYYADILPTPLFRKGNYLVIFIYFSLITAYTQLNGGYKIGDNRISESIYSNIISLIFVNSVFFFFISLMGRQWLDALPYIIICVIQIIYIIIWSVLANKIYFKIFEPRRIIYIYEGKQPGHILQKMYQRYDKYDVQKVVNVAQIENYLVLIEPFDAVVLDRMSGGLKEEYIKLAYRINKRVYLVPDYDDVLIENSMAINLLDSPLYLMKNRGLSFEQQFIKRILDLIICIPMLIILFPVFVVVAIMIKCEDGGPIFYKQSRLTLHGKEFQIYKFRSMIPDAEKVNGVQFMSNDDPRVTKIGRVTRKLRIDELPQLINIIKGEMSIVGPRPERPEVFDKLCEEFPEFRYRLTGKAGLTGYAQVMGKYNTALEDKLVFDLMYLENYSVVFDLKIILMTFKTIFDFHATEGVKEEEND